MVRAAGPLPLGGGVWGWGSRRERRVRRFQHVDERRVIDREAACDRLSHARGGVTSGRIRARHATDAAVAEPQRIVTAVGSCDRDAERRR